MPSNHMLNFGVEDWDIYILVYLARCVLWLRMKYVVFQKCLVCPYAKPTRSVFPSSSIKSVNCFDLVILTYEVLIIQLRWWKYLFLIVVDDYSRMTWIFLLKHTSDVLVSIKLFLQFVKTHFWKSVRIVRSDNGIEL